MRRSGKLPGLVSTRGGNQTSWRGWTQAVQGTAEALPALIALAVFLVWTTTGGAAAPHQLFAGGLFLLGLLAVSALAAPWTRTPRLTSVALAALVGYAVWSYASIGWAEVRGDAWTGANRTAIYAAVFALFSLRPWRPGRAAALLGAFAFGVGVIGLLVLLDLGRASSFDDLFVAGRLEAPIGYPNATAALFLLGFWPALFLASRRETPWAVRPLMLGIAGGLAGLALLPQSRGAVAAFGVAATAYLILVPGRLRSLATAAPVAAVLALGAPTLLGVFDAAGGPGLEEAVDDAVLVVVRSFAVLAVVGGVLAALDRILRTPAIPVPSRRVLVAATGGLLAAAALALALAADPAARVERAWNEFSSTPTADREGARLVGGLGGNRYDVWRVAAGEFVDHPVRGIGADNYATAYVRERRSEDEPRYPHSLQLQVLSQTGVVGGILLGAFLIAAFGAAWQAGRRADGQERAVAAVAGVVALYWLVHASVDWFWELPAVTAPALALLAVAGRVGGGNEPVRASRARATVAAAGALAVVVVVVPAWLAERHVARAISVWRAEPASAFEHLQSAAALNPLSERPALLEGAIASRLGEWERMERAFRRALERSPSSWYAELELAVALAVQERSDEALAHIRRAERLNPREPVLELVRARLVSGEPIVPGELDRLFRDRVALRTR
jgi:tetratricopeptide (TPR) repeat protein